MTKIFMYAVNPAKEETVVVETKLNKAIPVLEKYRKKELEMGFFGGDDFLTIVNIYEQYSPFNLVGDLTSFINKLEELLVKTL